MRVEKGDGMLRWIVVLCLVAVVAVAVSTSMNPKGVPVDTATAARREIREYVEEQAKTRLPDIQKVTMPLQGRVLPITLEEGDRVTTGQVVARLDESDLKTDYIEQDNTIKRYVKNLQQIELAIEQAEHAIAASQAKYDFAERTFARTRQLFQRGTASDQQLEADELQMTESRVDLRRDRLNKNIYTLMRGVVELMRDSDAARLSKIERDRARTEVRSSVDGVVLRREVSNETVLAAGTVLLEIGDPSQLEVEADILSQDVVKVDVGDPVDMIGAAVGSEPLPGKVARIYPQGFTKVSSLGVEQQRVKVIINFAEGSLDRLKEEGRELGVDYRLRVKIYTDERDHAVTVPRAAVFRSGSGHWQAFAIVDGKATLRDVTIGLRNDFFVEILEGVSVDEEVIVAPDSGIADGVLVAIGNE